MVQNMHDDDFGQRCLRVWTTLIGCALAHDTIPYPELAQIANVPQVPLFGGHCYQRLASIVSATACRL